MLSGKEHQWEFLSGLCEYFNNIGYPCWLDFGSLLGLVRDGAPIGWDTDIDIAVKIGGIDEALKVVDRFLYSYDRSIFDLGAVNDEVKTTLRFYGTKHWRLDLGLSSNYGFSAYTIDHELKRYSVQDSTIPKEFLSRPHVDFNIVKPYEDYLLNTEELVYFYERDVIFPLKESTLLGNKFLIPNKAENYLLLTYGEDWDIPLKLPPVDMFLRRINIIKNNIEYKKLWEDMYYSYDRFKGYYNMFQHSYYNTETKMIPLMWEK